MFCCEGLLLESEEVSERNPLSDFQLHLSFKATGFEIDENWWWWKYLNRPVKQWSKVQFTPTRGCWSRVSMTFLLASTGDYWVTYFFGELYVMLSVSDHGKRHKSSILQKVSEFLYFGTIHIGQQNWQVESCCFLLCWIFEQDTPPNCIASECWWLLELDVLDRH